MKEEIIQDNVEQESFAEKLAKKISLVIVKPENMNRTFVFPVLFRQEGLRVEPFEFEFTEEYFDKLYPDSASWPENALTVTKEHYIGQKMTGYLVFADPNSSLKKHDDVLNDVLHLIGTKTNPLECDPKSWRHNFRGKKVYYDEQDEEKGHQWENAFHRPKTPEELVSNLEAFGLVDRAKELTGI